MAAKALYGELFDTLDADGSGFLDATEGKRFLQCSGCEESELDYYWDDVVRSADTDSDGRIARDEFIGYTLGHEELDAAGEFVDKDQEAVLREEIASLHRARSVAVYPSAMAPSPPNVQPDIAGGTTNRTSPTATASPVRPSTLLSPAPQKPMLPSTPPPYVEDPASASDSAVLEPSPATPIRWVDAPGATLRETASRGKREPGAQVGSEPESHETNMQATIDAINQFSAMIPVQNTAESLKAAAEAPARIVDLVFRPDGRLKPRHLPGAVPRGPTSWPALWEFGARAPQDVRTHSPALRRCNPGGNHKLANTFEIARRRTCDRAVVSTRSVESRYTALPAHGLWYEGETGMTKAARDRFDHGVELAHRGLHAAAIGAFSDALRRGHPEPAPVLRARALSHRLLGQLSAAVSDFEAAAGEEPKGAFAQSEWAQEVLAQDRAQIDTFEKLRSERLADGITRELDPWELAVDSNYVGVEADPWDLG